MKLPSWYGRNFRYGIPLVMALMPSASSIKRWYCALVTPTANFSISRNKSTFGIWKAGTSSSGLMFSFSFANELIGPNTKKKYNKHYYNRYTQLQPG